MNMHWLRKVLKVLAFKSWCCLILANYGRLIWNYLRLWLLHFLSDWPEVHSKAKLKALFQNIKNSLNELIVRVDDGLKVLVSVKFSWNFLFELCCVKQCLSLYSLVGLQEVLRVELLSGSDKKRGLPVEAVH